MKLFTLPNIITLGNLFCGCLAIVCALDGNLVCSAYLVGIAAVLDFLDGFVARALKQYSAIGKDLDSLADMVTFGVVPGVVMYMLMKDAVLSGLFQGNVTDSKYSFGELWKNADQANWPVWKLYLPYAGFLITLFSALRLAKFNNDTRQSESFIGVPTPATSIFICSLPLIIDHTNYLRSVTYAPFNPRVWPPELTTVDQFFFNSSAIILTPGFLIAVTLLFSFLLISEIPLFSLKVKGFGWKGNELRYIFLLLSLVMIVLLKFIALPLVIVLYILMSVGNNLLKKKDF